MLHCGLTAYFLAGDFLAGDFLAATFLAGDFLAATFLAGDFFATATFLGAAAFLAGASAFLTAAFLGAATFLAAAFLGEATFLATGDFLAAAAFLGAATFLATTAFFFKGEEAFLAATAFLAGAFLADLADLTEEAADLTEEADFFEAVEAEEKTDKFDLVLRAGEAAGTDLGEAAATTFLEAGDFLEATVFFATALDGDFLAGEAMVGLLDLLGVRGVCPALLFLATVSTFAPFPSVAKELLGFLVFVLLGVDTILVGDLVVKVDGVAGFGLIGDLLNCNLGDAVNNLLGDSFLRPN